MKVEKPSDILDLLRAHYGASSDYQVGKMLAFEKSRVSVWRTNRSWPDDDLLLDFEKLLKMPAGSLYFAMLADRTKCPRAVSILHKTAEKAAAGLLCFMLVFPVFFADTASPAGHFVRALDCILCKIKAALICHPFELGKTPKVRQNPTFNDFLIKSIKNPVLIRALNPCRSIVLNYRYCCHD